MQKLISNFTHRPSVHCETSALRDILEYYGIRLSEPMTFGLGNGLGFIYWHSKQMPYPFVGGRTRDLTQNLCTNLGITAELHKTKNNTKAYTALKELISKDTPVMLHVDMPYLKYLELPEEAHFGAHVIAVVGIDEDKSIAYIADTAYKDLQTATLKELEQARSSTIKPFPPENKWLTFNIPKNTTPTKKAIKNSITQTAKTMLYPPIKNLGIKGINHLANEITKWPKLIPPEKPDSRRFYETTYIMMDEDGTGGGLFRFIYGVFLKEAGSTLGNEKLVDTGLRLLNVGQEWTETAKLIRGIPENEANVHEAKRILQKIAAEETEIFTSLTKLF